MPDRLEYRAAGLLQSPCTPLTLLKAHRIIRLPGSCESGQPSRFELMAHGNQPILSMQDLVYSLLSNSTYSVCAGGCPGCGVRNQAKSLPKWGLQEIIPRLA
eukprot:68203-Pelagomonas_calceolata.AAC.3